MKKLIIGILLAAISACNPYGEEQTFMEGTEISLTWKGNTQVRYNAENYQLSFNDHKNEYRVYDDKLADWFTLRCSELPVTLKQSLSADVSWTGTNSKKEFKGLVFEVQRTAENGMIWLWNSSEKIGIIIKNIK